MDKDVTNKVRELKIKKGKRKYQEGFQIHLPQLSK
jgi:hypothetical protein